MTSLKTIFFTTSILILLSACGSETQQKPETVLDDKIAAVNEAKKSVEALNERNEEVTQQITAATTEAISGSSLYSQRCASCHGKDAEKSALNVSQVIAGWKSTRTQNALNGYKSGTFGGKMKAIMEGQIRPLSEAEIVLIADYISAL